MDDSKHVHRTAAQLEAERSQEAVEKATAALAEARKRAAAARRNLKRQERQKARLDAERRQAAFASVDAQVGEWLRAHDATTRDGRKVNGYDQVMVAIARTFPEIAGDLGLASLPTSTDPSGRPTGKDGAEAPAAEPAQAGPARPSGVQGVSVPPGSTVRPAGGPR